MVLILTKSNIRVSKQSWTKDESSTVKVSRLIRTVGVNRTLQSSNPVNRPLILVTLFVETEKNTLS